MAQVYRAGATPKCHSQTMGVRDSKALLSLTRGKGQPGLAVPNPEGVRHRNGRTHVLPGHQGVPLAVPYPESTPLA
jgi:hypothetical protein